MYKHDIFLMFVFYVIHTHKIIVEKEPDAYFSDTKDYNLCKTGTPYLNVAPNFEQYIPKGTFKPMANEPCLNVPSAVSKMVNHDYRPLDGINESARKNGSRTQMQEQPTIKNLKS